MGGLGALAVLVFRQDGHEGLRKRAFGKHAPQQVGQAEGDEEGVGRHAGPEGARDHEVAHEAEDAGQQRHAADGGEGAQEVHAVGEGVGGRTFIGKRAS